MMALERVHQKIQRWKNPWLDRKALSFVHNKGELVEDNSILYPDES